MTIDISAFSFDLNAPDGATSDVMRVPSGLAAKLPLLEAYRQGLNLPDYFGNNWDALADCLRDLSWIHRHHIVIVHADLPGLSAQDQRVYLEILADSVKNWESEGGHELTVVFPSSCRSAILDLSEKSRIKA